MPSLIKLPWKFYLDHCDRNLPSPQIVKHNNRCLWVSSDDSNLESLRSDAEFYCDRFGPDTWPALRNSARATLEAINNEVAK